MAGTRTTAARLCPVCSAEAADADVYCEECGADLPATDLPPTDLPATDLPAADLPAADPSGVSDEPRGAASRPAPPAQDAAPGTGAAGDANGTPRAPAPPEPTVSLGSTASLGSTVSLETPTPAASPRFASPGRSCPACSSAAVGDDGYCLDCGLWLGSAHPGDHVEVDLGRLAGVSDRGLVHRHNEDAMGLRLVAWPDPATADGTGTAAIAVVCDGVSTVPGSGPAAALAAQAATTTLADWLAAARPHAPAVQGALRAATERAQRAMPAAPAGDPAPSCTFAAAIVTGTDLTVGWLGDSRVYLLGSDGGALRLTADDTLAAEAVRAGIIPPEAADTAPGAHTITRWLSPDRVEARPSVAFVPVTGPGRIVVCTDGLWNYASGVSELAAHVADLPPGASALAVARHLTKVALRAGGRDNITVVVIDMPGRG